MPALVVAGLLLVAPATAQVDGSRTVPRQKYFNMFPLYFAGEYGDALKGFRTAARSGVRSTEGRWIDSICYHTMLGECFYQMGELDQALEQYNSALKLFVAHQGWMQRVRFPSQITRSSSIRASSIPWGRSTRRATKGHIPDKLVSLQGRFDNKQVVRRGGVLAAPEYVPVQVQEIVRCVAVSLRRRRELMGPACPYDPLTTQLVTILSGRPGPANHWSQGWIDVLLGLAYACDDKPVQAMEHLNRGIVLAARFDHVLTPIVLLELGKLAMQDGKFEVASGLLLEATFAAVDFEQADVIEEAFRYAAMIHLVTNQPGMYPPLAPAANWARVHKLRALQASLLVLAAEHFTLTGNIGRATGALKEATGVLARRQMREGAIGASYQFMTALTQYRRGDVAGGDVSLAAAMGFQQKGSRRLFQIALVDSWYLSGAVSPRVAGQLFEVVLRDATPADWSAEPMEALAVCVTPHIVPLQHWFKVAYDRRNFDTAIEIADRIRRHRFHTSLPLGGRLLSLRWILEADPNAIEESDLLRRQDLLDKYPNYAELSAQARKIRAALRAKPAVLDDGQAARAQSDLYRQLADVSAAQEVILREIAVRREPADFMFPPVRDTKHVQEGLSDGQVILNFFNLGPTVYVFAISREKYSQWQLESPGRVRKQVADTLREIGMYDKNSALNTDQLQNSAWSAIGADLMSQFLQNAKPGIWDKYDELIVIPDGVLWYLPFELLQVTDNDEQHPLIDKVRIRYAPTLGLALPDGRGRKPEARTVIVGGELFNREDDSIAEQSINDLLAALPGAAVLPSTPAGPSSLMATDWDRLVVLDDIDDGDVGPYGWSPAQLDRERPGSTLASWFTLPWGAPDQLLLPGFHTAAEDGLKKKAAAADGSEIFLSLCGLMSTGTRTILLSRWRTGGQAAYDLTRELAQELPHTSASEAWHRSVQLLMQTERDPEREPRIRWTSATEPLSGDHPFFWAGYLLVDSAGGPPVEEQQQPGQPVLEVQPVAGE